LRYCSPVSGNVIQHFLNILVKRMVLRERKESIMKIKKTVVLLLIGMLTGFYLISNPAAASESDKGSPGNPCGKTAQDILKSCNAGAEDAYWLAIATCDNLPTSNEQKGDNLSTSNDNLSTSNEHKGDNLPTSNEQKACIHLAKQDKKSAIDECKKQYNARLDICASLGGGAYHPVINPADFSTNIDNPYYPLKPGTTFIYEGLTEKGNEHNETTVTNDTTKILGVTCVVVHDKVSVDDAVIEDTLDWYAQDKEGNVWYFGENSRQYEGNEVVSIDGSWKAGVNGAQAGIIVKANPKVGDIYRQEFAPGEAEDMGEVLSLTESTTVPFGGLYTNCLMTKDFSALEPDVTEHKFFAKGVGFLQAIDVDTGNGVKLINIIK
jgi:hypothetical protein